MKKSFFSALLLSLAALLHAQKKPLDHQAYDSWQSIGQKWISNDGNWIAYTVNLQEGDGTLYVVNRRTGWEKEIARGYQAGFSADNRYLVCRIKPLFKETREAKIRKKTPADSPKDSLAMLLLGTDSLRRIPQVKSYRMPEEGNGRWLVWLQEKMPPAAPDSLTRLQNLLKEADSLEKRADTLRAKVARVKNEGLSALKPAAAKGLKETTPKGGTAGASKETTAEADKKDDGTDAWLEDLFTGKRTRFTQVNQYYFGKEGRLLVWVTRDQVLKTELPSTSADIALQTDTLMKGFHEIRALSVSRSEDQVAFLAERDSASKALRKYHKLWYWEKGADSARLLAAAPPAGGAKKMVFQPAMETWFSEDGKRLFVGMRADWPVKDTSLVDFETARFDLWNYRDEYLQPQQLVQANTEKNGGWWLALNPATGQLTPLGSDSCDNIRFAEKATARYALGTSTKAYRIQQQWTANGMKKIYLVDLNDGARRLVADSVRGNTERISPAGNYISWYDPKLRHWRVYDARSNSSRTLTAGIKTPLYEEDDDHPDDPPPHGFMGWDETESIAYVYDRYDVWACDPSGKTAPRCLTEGRGRKNKLVIRFQRLDPEHAYIKAADSLLFTLFSEKTKAANWYLRLPGKPFTPESTKLLPAVVGGPLKAKQANVFVYQLQTPVHSDLYVNQLSAASDSSASRRLSFTNPQQSAYNWFTVETKEWKTFDGRTSEGLLYKPENFDPARKYPVILYFYEKDADRRYNYIEPAPVRASINIAYYTSNGYIVFDPNISYKTGQPGEDAYQYVVSAAKWLTRFPWVDSTRMGIQGHSWGGYQVGYLVTRTNMFAAAEAGAPVSNMTSAYGGIRWGTGISRQFQYEKTQSRLGATLWQDPQRYIKNSPLFRANRIQTPLLILHNDKDDAVPWYQGIELFTAMKRLGKKVWLINYNDELHGITERRNRKDWTIRMAQFFDHYLRQQPAPKWMTEGIPAAGKGIDWGF